MQTVNIRIADLNPSQKFDTDFALEPGDQVIVETATGAEWGVVESKPFAAHPNSRLTQVLRIADDTDRKTINKLITSADYAIRIANEKIEKYKLPMKLLSASYNFDASKVVIQFMADNRVDFRELVKDLAYSLRTRIELRQVGPRDEVKFLGALGPCGMPCCCVRFKNDFDNITIKMAKNQNIALNPNRINGVCGRLLCCLGYENDHYTETQNKMPRIGSEIKTPDGRGTVVDINMVSGNVKVKFHQNDTVSFKTFKHKDLKH
ncbi:MAG: stage 0 sporulation protein [Firmicutes bacterium]|nr:stage 0 sporulation protein [Bacillota bacterium]